MTDHLVEVAPAVPLPATARQTYTYRLSKKTDEAINYRSVSIPLGPRRVRGVIMRETKGTPRYVVKDAKLMPTAALTHAQVEFAEWLHTTQRGGLGYTLRLFVPPTEPITTKKRARRPATPEAIIHANHEQRWAALARRLKPFLKKQQPVLIIVPEKWQLAPLAAALAQKLSCQPLVIHAGLKKSTLQQAVRASGRGEALVVIGTQKALFLPYPSLGAVVLEEENYQTHKLWDQYPRLSNWHGVQQIATLHHATLFYTTNFPSVRLYGLLQARKVKSIGRLPASPKAEIAPLNFSERQKNYFLPRPLISALRGWLLKEKRVGFAHTLSLVRAKELRHSLYSALGRPANLTVGTPNEISTDRPQYDHLIWLFPEAILHYPDYRSREHACTLLYQFAQLLPPGQPLHLVTRFPRQLAEELLTPPLSYFEQELKARQRLHYPPFSEVVQLTIADRTTKQTERRAEKVRQELETAAAQAHVILRGPIVPLKTTLRPERHLILRGALPAVIALYRDTKITSADLDPLRIL